MGFSGSARPRGYRDSMATASTNYRTEQGLPGDTVTGFLETRRGDYWVATTDGIARFDPKRAGPSRFRRYPLGRTNSFRPVCGKTQRWNLVRHANG